jgi:hypothetical protein
MKANSNIISEPSNTPSFERGEVYGITAGLILLTIAILLTIFSRVERLSAYIPKLKLNKPRVDRLPQVKCEGCQYFHNSLYVKCAIHPTTAMTSGAIDCHDYAAKKQVYVAKKQTKIRMNFFNLFDN